MQRLLTAWAVVVLAVSSAYAQAPNELPRYKPEQSVAGTIRSWGNDTEVKLLGLWQEGFRKYHPDVQFSNNLVSTAIALPGLMADRADFGVMGREISHYEEVGFRRIFKYDPLSITVTTGSYDVEGKTFPMVIFVHKDNPITKLTLSQLDAIFGSEHRRGAPKDIHTWGDLGLSGEWADKPIHLYGYSIDSAYAAFFSQAVMKGSVKWNCDRFEGFDNISAQDGKTLQAGEQSVKALSRDKYGLAYSGIRYQTRDVKTIALAVREGGPYIEPTKANTINRSYPLIRDITMWINRAPGKPVSPLLKEFLRYILSREGQEDVIREGDYLPLTPDVVREQLRKLD
jgi:phosphate transport system substrate-binding protein